jgi:hypothetical protein
MAITTGDIIKVVAELLRDSVFQVVNTFWVEILDDDSNATSSILDDIAEFIEEVYLPMEDDLSNNVSFLDLAMYNFTKDETYPAEDWPTLTVGGGVTSGSPPGAAAFAWFPSGQPHVMSRKWFGPFTLTAQADHVWDSALTANVATGVANMIGGYEGSTGTVMRMVIPHLVEMVDGEPVDVDPPEFYPMTIATVTNNPGYQRRRRSGAGS